ncbi:MAG: hypothetical protein COV46_02570 [Deltaproteobacteria bacterium CG11_big_fil_rev_8_21_14_0_20_49_13]|nr:MAG: hypothetical protein COV46_02570 [Deltaproteobacteria bacterium CG11_big_fil_rev_8_21_14_0_20_49_13]
MITIEVAKKKIEKSVDELPFVVTNIEDVCGHVSAEEICARFDSPPFDRSAMDGFALKASSPRALKISQVINAGTVARPLKNGTCAKIMTGAMMPEGADTVVPLEETIEKGGQVYLNKTLRKGSFVRRRGREFKNGEVLVKKGEALNPASLGMLSGQGVKMVRTFGMPSVGILVTGDELVENGRLRKGKIFDSNMVIVSSLLNEAGFKVATLGISKDSARSLKLKIEKGLREDVLIVCGGVSVGERDLVKGILKSSGVKEVFWRVRQKPGKPLFFGKKGRRTVFGLPGNPAAVLVGTFEYVIPALKKMMGLKDMWHKPLQARLSGDIKWKRDRVEFICGIYKGNGVTPLPENESSMLKKLSAANALIIAKRSGYYRKGEMVNIHLL